MKIYLCFYPDPANNCFKTPDPWDCHGSIYDKLLKFKLCYHGYWGQNFMFFTRSNNCCF